MPRATRLTARFPRVASAAMWLLGPYVGGRYTDLRVLRIDAHADATHDSTARLGEIRCPVLIVRGTRSQTLAEDTAREMAATLPDARVVELDARHNVPLDRPRELADAIVGFARRMRISPG